jgi:hypothetical protein
MMTLVTMTMTRAEMTWSWWRSPLCGERGAASVGAPWSSQEVEVGEEEVSVWMALSL